MQNLSVNIRNCYGIRKLTHQFDFSNGCTHAIYAPNGAMKSSFAKIFDDLSKKVISKDRIFNERDSLVEVRFNDTNELEPESIFVIERYNENYSSKQISTLLVNQNLKEEYQSILLAIDEKKNELIKKLEIKTGLKKDLVSEFTKVFGKTEKDFFLCLEQIEEEILNEDEPVFKDIKYASIFNDDVLKFLNGKNFKNKIKDYIDTYDKLITSSIYFKKGVFNHNNADTVSKTLKTNGFFAASHSVSLNSATGKKELVSQEELDFEIASEKSKILTDDELSKRFKEMDDAMIKNVSLRDFRSYLENNLIVIPEIIDLKKFSYKLWFSYLKEEIDLYRDLLALYRNGKIRIEEIVVQAKKEETAWENVVEIFNDRFSVPYRILIKNQDDVILKGVSPNIVFEYYDAEEKKEISGRELISIISTGEQRALYLLNIIFEVEIRKNSNDKTLLIVDDIADSFDYRNKYAIIEYLKDIIESDKFNMIILTHNFDFYRTILSRLDINNWTNNHVSIKSGLEIKLVCGKDNLQLFGSLKKKFHENDEIFIACIPFVRNLIEYTIGTECTNYRILTACLHVKPEKYVDSTIVKSTVYITLKDLETIFNDVFKTSYNLKSDSETVLELIMKLCHALAHQDEEQMNLEKKLVLSIGIRLQAEVFMIGKIDNKFITEDIRKNQTTKLLKLYKEKFSNDPNVKILEQVNLMTTENIHLNSFMYEPLMDLSDHHLKKLYKKVEGFITA